MVEVTLYALLIGFLVLLKLGKSPRPPAHVHVGRGNRQIDLKQVGRPGKRSGDRAETWVAGTVDGIPVRIEQARLRLEPGKVVPLTSGSRRRVRYPASLSFEPSGKPKAKIGPVPGIPGSLALRERKGQAAGIQTGDPAFDQRFLVEGRQLEVCALLGQSLRSRLLSQRGQLSIGGRCLVLEREKAGGYSLSETWLLDLLDLAMDLVLEPAKIEQRLLDNVRQDPAAGVRRGSLELLAGHAPESQAALDALEAAARDTDPEVQLAAAAAAGERGLNVAARLLGTSSVPVRIKLEALKLLGQHGRTEQDVQAMVGALEEPDIELRRTAVKALGRAGSHQLLLSLLPRSGPELHSAFRQALGMSQAQLEAHLRGVRADGGLSLSEQSSGSGSLSLAGEPGSLSLHGKKSKRRR